jgi:glycerol-3-phosphate acyltransferase PlsX
MGEHPATEAIRAKKDSSIVRGHLPPCTQARRTGSAPPAPRAPSFAAATFGVGRITRHQAPGARVAVSRRLDGRQVRVARPGRERGRDARICWSSSPTWVEPTAKVALGADDPKVALLSNGSEDTKGSEMAVVAEHAALAEGKGGDTWFAGNCRGHGHPDRHAST